MHEYRDGDDDDDDDDDDGAGAGAGDGDGDDDDDDDDGSVCDYEHRGTTHNKHHVKDIKRSLLFDRWDILSAKQTTLAWYPWYPGW